MSDKSIRSEHSEEFVNQAARPRQSLLTEFWTSLRYNRKLYLAPIIVALVLIGMLVILGGTAAAPFIYTLF